MYVQELWIYVVNIYMKFMKIQSYKADRTASAVVQADKLFALGQLLNVVHGGKEFSNVHSNQDFP